MVMDWGRLRIFHAVAEAGSFTHAGDALNLSQSAVSRQISALEKSMNVTLFHRHARGLILTEQGEMLYRTAHDIFAKLAMVEAQLTESKERPQGQLKITATVALGSTWLAPRMREFMELYPDIQIDLVLDDRELDLSMREADVAIRMMPPRQPELIQRHLITTRVHIYASPVYLRKHGTPHTSEELDQHRLIVYGEEMRPPIVDVNWLLHIGAREAKPRRPVLAVNNIYAIMRAAQTGLGIVALPEFMAKQAPDLVRILSDVEGPRYNAYFVYPEELRNSKRIQVFRDFLLRKVAEGDF